MPLTKHWGVDGLGRWRNGRGRLRGGGRMEHEMGATSVDLEVRVHSSAKLRVLVVLCRQTTAVHEGLQLPAKGQRLRLYRTPLSLRTNDCYPKKGICGCNYLSGAAKKGICGAEWAP